MQMPRCWQRGLWGSLFKPSPRAVPCWGLPVPGGSRTDPPVPKAESIRHGCGTSATTYFRKGKNTEQQLKQCERNSPVQSGKEGGGDALDAGAEISLQLMVKNIVTGCIPAAHVGTRWSRYPPAAHGGPHTRAWGHALKEATAPGEPMQKQVFGQDLQPCEGPTLEHSFPEGLYTMERTHAAALFSRITAHENDPVLQQFVKDCIPREGPHAGAGEQREEEGAAEMK